MNGRNKHESFNNDLGDSLHLFLATSYDGLFHFDIFTAFYNGFS